MSTIKSSLLALCGLALASTSAFAAPAIVLDFPADAAGTYKPNGKASVRLLVDNTANFNGSGVPGAAAENAANTAYNIRVSKLLLEGFDIYGNPVTIATSDLRASLGSSVDLGPENSFNRTISFSIPNDGTLYDMSDPGYRVVVEVIYELQNGTERTLFLSTASNVLVDAVPNLRLPSMTFPARTDHRGGEVVQFTSFIYNDKAGEGSLSGRPLRPVEADYYRLNTYLTTDPQIGGSNNDDFLLNFMDLAGDSGGSRIDSQSIVRRIRTVGTPAALPPYGDPSDPTTQRIYTPQPDDGYLDLGETVVLDYEVLVPQNYRGLYFVAGFVDALNNIAEPTGFRPSKESDVVPCDNQYVSAPAVRFGIQATDSPVMDIVSGEIDEDTGALTRAGNDDSDLPALSRRGEVVAFSSYATNLDSAGATTNGRRHIYAKITNLRTGVVTTKLVSRSSAGALANADCTDPVVSGNGRFIAFSSAASNLVDKDSNGLSDIFVHDLLLGKTTRVSLTGTGLQANGASFAPSLTSDGRFVAFHSRATNLRPAGTLSGGGIAQVFVVDRDKDGNGTFDEIAANKIATYLVSIDKRGVRADALSYLAKISGDGKFVAFVSHATNLDSASSVTASGKGKYGRLPFSSIYRIGLNNGAALSSTLDVVSVPDETLMPGLTTDATSYELAINGDGKHIAFTSQGTDLVPEDTNGVGDVFVRDYSGATPKTVRVSTSAERSATGTLTILGSVDPLLLPDDNVPADNVSAGDSITLDDGLIVPARIFTVGGNWTLGANASASRDNLVQAINNARAAGLNITARAVTPAIGITGFLSSASAYYPSIELYNLVPGAQGNTFGSLPAVPSSVEFSGMAGGGTQADDPEQDLSTPAEDLLTVPSGSNMPSIDESGRFVAFRSVAANLDVYTPDFRDAVPAPRNSLRDGERIRPLINYSSNVYVHDRNALELTDPVSGAPVYDQQGNWTSTRISVNKFGYPTIFLLNTWSSANSHSPAISGNGQKVVFSSDSENNSGLIFGRNNQSPLDFNERRDVFACTRGGVLDEGDAADALDSQVIAFQSFASPIRFDQLQRFGQLGKIALEAVATSGLPVTFSSSNPQVAYVSGKTLNVVGVGTTVITASQEGDGSNWLPAPEVTQTLVVSKGQQSIVCPQPPSLRVGESLKLAASASSGLGLVYKTLNSSVATVSQTGLITGVDSGSAVIQISQAGSGLWEPAPVKTITIQVTYSQAPRIVFALTPAEKMRTLTPTKQTITLKASSDNAGKIYYESSNPAVVSVEGNIATILAPGSADIYAKQDATEDYPAAVAVKQTIVVSKGNPGALTALPTTVKIGEVSEIALQATDAFGRALTHTSSNPAVANVVGGKLMILAPGTAAIRSTVAADAQVGGIDVVRNLTVTAGTQKILWAAPIAMIDGSLKPSPAPRTTSTGVVVNYTSDNTAAVRVTGNVITVIGKGFANVTASAPSTATYSAPASVTYRIGRPY